jgi:hypothetical protein
MLARRDRVAADGADDARVAQGRVGRDDRVGNVVVERRVFLLLDLNHAAVLELPLDDVRLVRGALAVLGLVEGAPELGELVQLDKVPDVRQRGCWAWGLAVVS